MQRPTIVRARSSLHAWREWLEDRVGRCRHLLTAHLLARVSNRRLKLSGAARFGWVPFDEMAQQQWNIG
jgi:hypothetical protein